MAKVLFVDDRPNETIRQWERSGCEGDHELLPLEPFASIERTCQLVRDFDPSIIFIGYGLSKSGVTGADVIRALRHQGYAGRIVANSGGGAEQFAGAGVEVDATADRQPKKLADILERN